MISMLLYLENKKELQAFVTIGGDVVCRISDDDWDFLSYYDKQKLIAFLKENPVIDISCVDVTSDGGIGVAESLRSGNENMYMIIVADNSVSPATYIKPTVMAGSLLLRPLNKEIVKEVFFEAVNEYMRKFFRDDTEDVFVINSHEGRQLIPHRNILFFESRDKKIYINTNAKEYAYCDTLDNLETSLSGDFIRCHRSYIVSKPHISKIMLSQNTIVLDNGFMVPLSRSYKSVFKGMK